MEGNGNGDGIGNGKGDGNRKGNGNRPGRLKSAFWVGTLCQILETASMNMTERSGAEVWKCDPP